MAQTKRCNVWGTSFSPSGNVKKRNSRPEMAVQKQLFDYMNSVGFRVFVMEAKNVRSVTNSGRIYFRNSGVSPGTPDLLACSPDGWFVAVEVKAPGKRSTLRLLQRNFLIGVIKKGGFGIVCDSIEHFEKTWKEFTSKKNKEEKIRLLIDDLPRSNKFTIP